jgi:hypothetical protein
MKAFQKLAILLLASSLSTAVQAQKIDAPTVTVQKIETQKEADFLKNNPTIATVHWQKGSKIVLGLKDGNKETYILNDPDQQKIFTDKYGARPIAPPPPPVKKH